MVPSKIEGHSDFPVKMDPKDLPELYETIPTAESVEMLFVWLKSLGPERDMLGIDYNRMAEWVFEFYNYDTPLRSFVPVRYEGFYDWFLRRLSPEARLIARYKSNLSQVCSPVEALVSYKGKIGDGSIELKQGKANLLKALENSVPEIGSHNFLKFNLRKCYYHRVHSPVDGIVEEIIRHPQGTGAFGNNSVTCLKISIPEPVFVCAIGEKSVQSFNCLPKVGDRLDKMDELGWFWWGSMVLLSVPPSVEFRGDLPEKVFVGDPLLRF